MNESTTTMHAPTFTQRDTQLGPEQQCTRCREWWPADGEFYRCRTGKPGCYMSWCRACETEDQNRRRLA